MNKLHTTENKNSRLLKLFNYHWKETFCGKEKFWIVVMLSLLLMLWPYIAITRRYGTQNSGSCLWLAKHIMLTVKWRPYYLWKIKAYCACYFLMEALHGYCFSFSILSWFLTPGFYDVVLKTLSIIVFYPCSHPQDHTQPHNTVLFPKTTPFKSMIIKPQKWGVAATLKRKGIYYLNHNVLLCLCPHIFIPCGCSCGGFNFTGIIILRVWFN